MPAATTLAEHFAAVRPSALPASQLHEMNRLLLDFLGVALSGSQTDSGRIAAATMSELGGPEQATVLGSGHRLPAMNAAFANAIAEHSIELDDVDDLALFHHGPPVVAAALATAQWQQAGGRDLLAAMLCGCEAMNRVSLAVNPRLRDRGFHTTPTAGVFGATVAAAWLLGLDRAQLTSALGLAGAQAGGLMEMYGPSMQKRFNPGPTARAGITAVMMARNGFTGTDSIFEGERGFGNAFADGLDVDVLLAGLGDDVPVAVEYKAYSAARPIHNAIDAALRLRERGLRAEQVETLVVHRHPDWSLYHRNDRPTTYHEAQVSLPFSTAVALLDGAALPENYTQQQIERTDIAELVARISIETDDALPRGVSCRIEVTTSNGTRLTEQVDDAKGSLGNPMTDDDLAEKFTRLATPVLAPGAAERVVEAVWSISDAPSLGPLLTLCTPPTQDGEAVR